MRRRLIMFHRMPNHTDYKYVRIELIIRHNTDATFTDTAPLGIHLNFPYAYLYCIHILSIFKNIKTENALHSQTISSNS